MNLNEVDKPEVKKTVVVYAGRFQPFHKGHYVTYLKLCNKFGRDNVYIGTSNDTSGSKSPFNFNEKVKIMTTMFGIPSDKIVQVKNPYAPKEILSKFDGKTTQYIAAVGEKDATRLQGKYFKPYKNKAGYGYDEIGYVYAVPAEVNAISGTNVRNWLGNGDDEKMKKGFLKAYPKFDKEIYKMITGKLNENGFPGGIGVGLVLPGGYINGAPTGSTNETNNTNPSSKLRPEPHPTRHETEHPSDEPNWYNTNELYDPISELLGKVAIEEIFEEFTKSYFNEEPNPIMDREFDYTAADGKKKKITVRGALRLPKEHPAHIQAKKIVGPDDAPVNEPNMQKGKAATQAAKPSEPGQPTKKGQTAQGKIDTKTTNEPAGMEAPNAQKLNGDELKSSAEISPKDEKSKEVQNMLNKAKNDLSTEDATTLENYNNTQSAERKSMADNLKMGLKQFGKGLQNWAHHKKEMLGGTSDAIKALANGQKIGSIKNKETGKWEYSDEKRKEQINHIKHTAIDIGLILGSMALGGAGSHAVSHIISHGTHGAIEAGIAGGVGAFTHGITGFGTHLVKDIAKHATLEAMGLKATHAAASGAGLATASMGIFEVIDNTDKFLTNLIKEASLKMENYQLSDEEMLESIESYNKQKPQQAAQKLIGNLNENISETKKESIQNFIEYATNRLNLKEIPKVTLVGGKEYGNIKSSLGGYNPDDKTIYVATEGRLTADILRTLAHEMVHRKQDEMGYIKDSVSDGADGSPIENQAHSIAGILMREYGRINKQIYQEGKNSPAYKGPEGYDDSCDCYPNEDINLDVDKGDTLLMGKFKNKKVTVKDIGVDDHGMPTINGKKATTFRIPRGEAVNEVGSNDWHFKAIMKMWDMAGSFGRKKIAAVVCNDPKADRNDVARKLRNYGYKEVTYVTDKLGLNEKKNIKEKLTHSNLDSVEKYADRELSPADIEFSNHFFDRVNDTRNGKEISEPELTGFFKRLARHKKEFLSFLDKYNQIVVKDDRSDINIPFVKMANKVIAKTVMRKDDFKTSSPTLVNELTQGLFAGKIKIGGKTVDIEVELFGADNKTKEFLTKVIHIDKEYQNKLPIGSTFRIPARIFRTPGGGWHKIKVSAFKESINSKNHKPHGSADYNFMHHHKTSGYAPDFGYPAELDTIDFDDKRKKQPGHQPNTKDTEDFGYEPVKKSLNEGGAYGHMSHPFDDMDLTFGDLKKIIKGALTGNLELTREKTDGQALAISWKNGRLIAARNKGHLANAGANAMGIEDVASKFGGRGGLTDAYNFAMKDLTAAIQSLSEAQRKKIFNEGQCFMNLEVIWPTSVNVIPYGQALLVFHNTTCYDEKGIAIGANQSAATMLAGMIKQVNADVQSKYTIQGPPVTELPKNEELSSKQTKYLTQLQKLQFQFQLSDKDGVSEYHQAWWEDFVNKSKVKLQKLEKEALVRRWAFGDKSFRLNTIADKNAQQWAIENDKVNVVKQQKENVRQFEEIFLGVGADVLSFMGSVLTVNPDAAVRNMKQRLKDTADKVRGSGDPSKIAKLKMELERMKSIGGSDKIVPNEGIVFVYKGNTYKLTGTFAPLNQILGIFYE